VTQNNNEDAIVIKRSKLKELAAKGLRLTFKVYDEVYKLTVVWRFLIPSSSTFRKLLDDPAVALFFNTVLLAFFGKLFGGLIGQIALYAVILNIFGFLFMKMEWYEKLIKDIEEEK